MAYGETAHAGAVYSKAGFALDIGRIEGVNQLIGIDLMNSYFANLYQIVVHP
jgi:hypothetical protein